MPRWRDDIDALEFQPTAHRGLCVVHRRAFRTLLRTTPSPLVGNEKKPMPLAASVNAGKLVTPPLNGAR